MNLLSNFCVLRGGIPYLSIVKPVNTEGTLGLPRDVKKHLQYFGGSYDTLDAFWSDIQKVDVVIRRDEDLFLYIDFPKLATTAFSLQAAYELLRCLNVIYGVIEDKSFVAMPLLLSFELNAFMMQVMGKVFNEVEVIKTEVGKKFDSLEDLMQTRRRHRVRISLLEEAVTALEFQVKGDPDDVEDDDKFLDGVETPDEDDELMKRGGECLDDKLAESIGMLP